VRRLGGGRQARVALEQLFGVEGDGLEGVDGDEGGADLFEGMGGRVKRMRGRDGWREDWRED
jgi:hypothetical protein